MAVGGAEIDRMAQLALSGTPQDVRDFLDRGQHVARARDQELLTMVQLVDLAKQAQQTASEETKAAKDAASRAVAAAGEAKSAARTAAAETAAARDSAVQAAAAAGRAADAASRAAAAAQDAIGAANAANRAARLAANAASRASTAATMAGNAAARANRAAAAARTDASKAGDARAAAEGARAAASTVRGIFELIKVAVQAANAARDAASAARSAIGNADQAAAAADEAGGYANVAASEAARARREAARARALARQAERSAVEAERLAGQAATAAQQAYDLAVQAATHAEKAADTAERAAAKAGQAQNAASDAKAHAADAAAAAATATTASTRAADADRLARDADTQRLALETEQARARARELREAEDQKVVRPAWDVPELERVDAETTQLLTQAAAPDVPAATVVSNVRRAALRLMDTGGQWTQAAARVALAGGEADLRDFLTRGRLVAAEQDDRARLENLAGTSGNPALQAAAESLLKDGTHQQVVDFLHQPTYESAVRDDRIAIAEVMAAGGAATDAAAQKALDGTPAEAHEFLRTGQYEAAARDDRAAIAEIMAQGGPEVDAAAQIALDGTRQMARQFMALGQYKAQQRDLDTATHVATVRGYVAEATRYALLANADAARAAEIAAYAENKADEARGYALRAGALANEAAGYADQAAASAAQARQSAEQAAASAQTARAAATEAGKAARAASRSANQATASATLARGYADEAYAAADDARASALAAGKDADAAMRAANEALNLLITQFQQESEEDGSGGDPDGPVPDVREFENSTSLIEFGGVCYLNGFQLPAKLGAGSCVELAADFDEWVGDWAGNILWDNLQNNPDAAGLLLLDYCNNTRHGISVPWDSPDTCGAELKRQLKAAYPVPVVTRTVESGAGGGSFRPLARYLGLTAKVPSVLQLTRGAHVKDFLNEASAFQHYAKHVKGVELKNGKSALTKEGIDMPEFTSYAQYRAAARAFMGDATPAGVHEGTRSGGALVRMDSTGILGVRSPDGVIRTFFRPNRKGLTVKEYFEKEVGRG